MRAFASGCTAMTGVEAVSNGVGAFREPSVPHARRTLTAIIALLALMLAGIAYLCQVYGIAATEPGKPGYESVLSQLVVAIVGRGFIYYLTIGSVLVVLALSANTGFADFPRLCRVVAQDGFLPNAFAHRGRRLVYSRGILVLAALAGGLLIAFDGITDHLIPLFAVGAFLAFTMSQAGMVEHWRKVGGDHSGKAMAINAAGAVCTAITLVVVLISKFAEGAWIMILLIPTLLVAFLSVNAHYRSVGKEVATDLPLDATNLVPPLVLVPIRGWSAIARKALRFAFKISPDIYALHVADDEQAMIALEDGWERHVRIPSREAGLAPPQLIVTYSPFRRLYSPLKQVLTDPPAEPLGARHRRDRPGTRRDPLVSLHPPQPDRRVHQGVSSPERISTRCGCQCPLVSGWGLKRLPTNVGWFERQRGPPCVTRWDSRNSAHPTQSPRATNSRSGGYSTYEPAFPEEPGGGEAGEPGPSGGGREPFPGRSGPRFRGFWRSWSARMMS